MHQPFSRCPHFALALDETTSYALKNRRLLSHITTYHNQIVSPYNLPYCTRTCTSVFVNRPNVQIPIILKTSPARPPSPIPSNSPWHPSVDLILARSFSGLVPPSRRAHRSCRPATLPRCSFSQTRRTARLFQRALSLSSSEHLCPEWV